MHAAVILLSTHSTLSDVILLNKNPPSTGIHQPLPLNRHTCVHRISPSQVSLFSFMFTIFANVSLLSSFSCWSVCEWITWTNVLSLAKVVLLKWGSAHSAWSDVVNTMVPYLWWWLLYFGSFSRSIKATFGRFLNCGTYFPPSLWSEWEIGTFNVLKKWTNFHKKTPQMITLR